MTTKPTLLISEIFGPVWQGEGPQRGQRAVFVRLATCNLACSWCDTPYAVFYDEYKAKKHVDGRTYDPKAEIRRMTIEEVGKEVRALVLPVPNPLVVFTGGEPLLQAGNLGDLSRYLEGYGYDKQSVETAGTRRIKPMLERIGTRTSLAVIVSPKLANSGNDPDMRFKLTTLVDFANRGAMFKFVVTSPNDLPEIEMYVRRCGLLHEQVWIMPEGRTTEEVLAHAKLIEPYVQEAGYNFTLRDHVLLHNDDRGV